MSPNCGPDPKDADYYTDDEGTVHSMDQLWEGDGRGWRRRRRRWRGRRRV